MTRPILQRIPLSVVGGFLGSGKTTLVNRLLATARGRIAVLVNDFGAVNIDAGLILAHDGETLRLTNGCVCCSMSDDFMATVIRVLDAPEPFDHVLIEASGVGDPWSIAEIALVEPQLALNAVIVLADAERVAGLLDDPRLGETVQRQVESADILLLNKVDLVDAATHAGALAKLAALKPALRIVSTVEAMVPDALLDMAPNDMSPSDMTPSDVAPSDVAPAARPSATPVDHETLFHRILYRRDAVFDRERLDLALRDLPPSLLRLKGRCAIRGEADVLLQLVAQRWSLARAACAEVAPSIELVGIATDRRAGRHVAERLDAALAQDSHVRSATHVLPSGDRSATGRGE